MDAKLARKVEAYLGRVLALPGFRVISAEPISGAGLSRRVVKLVTTSEAGDVSYILLLEQSGSPVEPNRRAEFAVLRALGGHPAIKVAPAYWLEPDPQPLGAPFLLTGLLPGIAHAPTLLQPDFEPIAPRIVEESCEILGRLAALDTCGVDLTPLRAPPLDALWAVELDRWETMLVQAGHDSLIVTRAALRRLHRAPPRAPARLSIVHGDYRVANYLFDRDGITGVIDWEMVHLGDPLEDLAWSLMPNWQFAARPGLIGGFLTPAEAQAAWERNSGIAVDPVSLAWWTLFCHVKAVAIWATARHRVASGGDRGMFMALVGYGLVEKQEAVMAALLRAAP